ncbi:DoxX family protein [Oxalicibacterium faecigallinarum]|uniref:LysR family transcriptional regulator n=1 Tax=Oxalicibacterium faecigallinarum TaxID=573741 RepID=A0A8J3F5E7_9BURK|nr:DoxX family protein [Oxalicibacterium faecigallinarum]GGI17826.1 LysR family transcriptional regulator [Oxalicibacterium faecigallinarum]
MNQSVSGWQLPRIDAGLFFLRVAGAFMLFYVHGLPKIVHYTEELSLIEDPLGLGRQFSLLMAIFAEVVCPLFIAAGVFTRLACLPVLAVLIVSMFVVHTQWSIAEGQFGWLLMIIFGTIALCGPGNWSLSRKRVA